MQHYVIKFVSGFLQYYGFLHQKTDRHVITEILLKVELTLTPPIQINESKKNDLLVASYSLMT